MAKQLLVLISAAIRRYLIGTPWPPRSSSWLSGRPVGDYYTDAVFPNHWSGADKAGVLKTAYHVIAPADTLITRKISAEAQMDLFFRAMGDREPDLPIVLDCELAQPDEGLHHCHYCPLY